MSRYQIIIEPGRSAKNYWRDLWRYRELLFTLAWRDISVHYKQTVVGIAWAVIRPLTTVLVFTLVFGRIAGLTSAEVPYLVLVMAGVLPWQLFATCLSESSNSLVANNNLVSKVYFPRLLVPFSSLAVGLVDFMVTLPFLFGLCAYYEIWPTWRIATLPVFMLLAFLTANSLGLWLCALNVRFRDVRYIIPFLIQFGQYLSPVGYGIERVPKSFRWLYELNPMAGIINGFRWSLYGGRFTPGPQDAGVNPLESLSFYLSLALVAVMLYGGVRYFRKTERTFADVI
jgi:lipopolysaccharide transport system permease protein